MQSEWAHVVHHSPLTPTLFTQNQTYIILWKNHSWRWNTFKSFKRIVSKLCNRNEKRLRGKKTIKLIIINDLKANKTTASVFIIIAKFLSPRTKLRWRLGSKLKQNCIVSKRLGQISKTNLMRQIVSMLEIRPTPTAQAYTCVKLWRWSEREPPLRAWHKMSKRIRRNFSCKGIRGHMLLEANAPRLNLAIIWKTWKYFNLQKQHSKTWFIEWTFSQTFKNIQQKYEMRNFEIDFEDASLMDFGAWKI